MLGGEIGVAMTVTKSYFLPVGEFLKKGEEMLDANTGVDE